MAANTLLRARVSQANNIVEASRERIRQEENLTRRQNALQKISKWAREKWKDRWTNGATGAHLQVLARTSDKKVRKLYTNRRKAESSLLVQLRTGKIGFNDFLYSRGVPQVRSKRCACRMGDMTVKHVVLTCQTGRRAQYLSRRNRTRPQNDLSTREKATAAIRMTIEGGRAEWPYRNSRG
jgi:hypothetical protein